MKTFSTVPASASADRMQDTATELAPPGIVSGESTRRSLLMVLQASGALTVAELAQRVGLTAQGVRRHLDGLLDSGEVVAQDPGEGSTRGRGRPARRFQLTSRGRDSLGHAYDDLARDALRYLHSQGGDQAVAAFAGSRASAMAARYEPMLATVAIEDRLPVLAELLNHDGYASTMVSGEESVTGQQPGQHAGQVLCQHHCPVSSVAAEFPQLCEAETAMIARLVARDVSRLGTIASGNVSCLTYVSSEPHPISQESA